MVDYAKIQHKIDRGIGIAARKLGPPYKCLRVTSLSTGDFPGGWTTITASFPLFSRKAKNEKQLFLGIYNTTQWLDIISSMEPYLLGDVFLLIDPPYQPGVSYGAGATSVPGTQEINALALAWHPPVRVPVGARLDHLARIYRPAVLPASVTSAGGVSGDYWRSTKDNDLPLILSAGTFAFGVSVDSETAASLVPCGLLGATRRTDTIFDPGVPGMPKLPHWLIYLPPLPGYEPREGDAIIIEDGARYVVISPFIQASGVSGSMLLCDRKISQGAG